MGVKGKPNIIDIIQKKRLQCQKDARGENTKINYGMDTLERRKRDVQNVDGRSTSSHDNMKFGTRSMEKQRGLAFGLRKIVTAVIKPNGWIDG
jgi:hypothetical protein